MRKKTDNGHLPRLNPDSYRGRSYVHWTMTIQDRRTGWLTGAFHAKVRELLTHTAFRYAVACPIYCLMPDHMHLMWIGVDERTDQLKASKYFRKQLGIALSKRGFQLQHQPYDHVLRDDERQEEAFENIVEYIARNPERKNLIPPDHFRDYRYTDCLIPGYPELHIWQQEFWPRFWRTYSFLQDNGLFRPSNEVTKKAGSDNPQLPSPGAMTP